MQSEIDILIFYIAITWYITPETVCVRKNMIIFSLGLVFFFIVCLFFLSLWPSLAVRDHLYNPAWFPPG